MKKKTQILVRVCVYQVIRYYAIQLNFIYVLLFISVNVSTPLARIISSYKSSDEEENSDPGKGLCALKLD